MRRLNDRMLMMLIAMFMSWGLSAFANPESGEWAVNPADYRYDMSLYFNVSLKASESMDSFEVGAFVGDECRGVAETLELPENGECGYLRIHSNASKSENEVIELKIRDKRSGAVRLLTAKDGSSMMFEPDVMTGLPSEPYILYRCYNVSITGVENGTVDFNNGQYPENKELSIEAVPSEGYHFEHWSDGVEDAKRVLVVTDDLELSPVFAANLYKIVFKIGEEIISEETVAYGEAVKAPEAPAKEGYTFAGWDNLPETMPAGDLEIFGSYTVNSYKLVFKIGEDVISEETVAYGEAVKAPEAPAKEGHTFSGWANVPETMPASDLEIVGSYTVNSYKLVFKIGEDVISEETVAYGEAVKAPEAPAKEGYTFAGWDNLPETMPARDLEIVGNYTVNSYKLVFKIGEEVISEETVAYGEAVKAPEAPAKEGYTFMGWENIPETMPAGDLEIVGSYTVNSYKVVFKIGEDVISEETVAYGEAVKAPEVPTKEGYTFAGWENMPETMPAGDLVIVGSYTINSYKVVFKIGEEVISEETVAYGEAVKAPEAPAKEGYTFAGWENVPETMPASDIEIVGSYTVNSYKVVFKIGEDVISEETVAYGESVKAPEAPTKEGYTFAGWDNLPETMPASDLEIVGSYTVNSYKVVFKIGEEVISEETVAYGEAVKAPEAPTKEGYTFAGWENVPETMPAGDLEIIGSYTVNSYKVVFKIGEEVISEETVAYGEAVKAPEAPTKEGYTFAGWENVPETMPAGDLVIVGNYTVNSYKVVFKIGEEVISEETVAYGEAVKAPEAPAKEGYTFAGWENMPETMPAGDIEIFGSYTVNSYKVVFKIGEEVFSEATVAYGDAINLPEVPAKEGYTFSGWANVPETMPASDLEISGHYVVNGYKVVFKIGEDVISEVTVSYGDAINVPEAPAKEGHTFSGWANVPETMPASDIEIVGSYTVNSYKVVFKIGEEVFSEATVAYGDAINVPEVPAKEGYTFSGWENVPETMPASDLEISGHYVVNGYKVVFKIGDEIISEVTVSYGDAINVPEAPAKEGHTFSGWANVPETMPASDIEIFGSYTVNSYKVVFKIGEEVFSEETVAYGEAVKAPEAPAKEGYTFAGWENVPETMPASDIEIFGSYTVNSYKVVFKIGEEVISEETVAYGEAVKAPEAPAKEGYTFAGWENMPETMPASDIEIVGSYTVNSYKLVFKIGEEVISEETVAYGEAVKAPEAPAKEGYTFAGWENVPETMPASDLEINGTYSINSYRLLVYVDDEVYMDIVLEYGTEVEIPDPEVPDTKIFEGWKEEIPETMPACDLEIHGTTSDRQSSVDGVNYGAGTTVTVFDMNGRLLFKDADSAEVMERLSKGLYIINGKKVYVK